MSSKLLLKRIPGAFFALLAGIFLFQVLLLPLHDSRHAHGQFAAGRGESSSGQPARAAEECRCDLCLLSRALDPATASPAPELGLAVAQFAGLQELQSLPAHGWLAPVQARGPPAITG